MESTSRTHLVYPEEMMRDVEEVKILPDELLLAIFHYLDFLKPNTTELRLVCRQWKRLVNDISLRLQRLTTRQWTIGGLNQRISQFEIKDQKVIYKYQDSKNTPKLGFCDLPTEEKTRYLFTSNV